jgi:hypothetical protein
MRLENVACRDVTGIDIVRAISGDSLRIAESVTRTIKATLCRHRKES